MRAPAPALRAGRLGVLTCALTGGAVFGILFVLAWATSAFADVPGSGAFLAFFTQQATRAPHPELAWGLARALGLGVLIGSLVAIGFNLAVRALRR
jgi:hypothetical protein